MLHFGVWLALLTCMKEVIKTWGLYTVVLRKECVIFVFVRVYVCVCVCVCKVYSQTYTCDICASSTYILTPYTWLCTIHTHDYALYTYTWLCTIHTHDCALYTYTWLCTIHTRDYALYIHVIMHYTRDYAPYTWLCTIHVIMHYTYTWLCTIYTHHTTHTN